MKNTFEELYEKYHNHLFQFIFYMVKNRQQAEDIVQEVYLRVLKSYDGYQEKSSEKTWIFSIARFVVIDSFRKQKRWRKRLLESFDLNKQSITDPGPIPEEIAMKNEQVQLLYHCLDKCNVDQRSVLILRYIQSLSIAETAEVLGWTQGKVKTTQHRALKAVRSYMEMEKEVENHEKFRTEG